MSPFALIILSTVLGFLLFHSLRRLAFRQRRRLPPGPRPWPLVGNLPQLGPKPHSSMAELARVHGPLMHLKMGFVDVVVASSASVAEQFLKVHDANFANRPRTSGAKHVAYNYEDLVFRPYGPKWRLLRKICAQHIFSVKAMDDFKHVREEEVAILSRALAVAGKAPIHIAQMLNVCATNALSRVMMGRRVVGHEDGTNDAKAEEFKAMVVELMAVTGVFNIGDFIPFLEPLDLQGVASRMKKLHRRFDEFLTEIVRDRSDKIDGRDHGHVDLLSTLISLKEVDDDGSRLTDTEIKALLLNLFTAGTDTTASTVEWAVAELLRHPKMLSELRQELDSVVGKSRLVSESDLNQTTYLQAVVKEVFRLHPPTPLSLPRVAEEDCEVDGYHVPKGSTLLVNVWAIARDPTVWSDPLEFRPGRFMKGGEKAHVDVRGNDFEVIPFGSGRRICAGLGLGIRMVQLLSATLIHGFDFDLGDGISAGELNMGEAYGLTLQRAESLLIRPRPRLAAHVY